MKIKWIKNRRMRALRIVGNGWIFRIGYKLWFGPTNDGEEIV